MTNLYCNQCGATVEIGHNYCLNCGARVMPQLDQPLPPPANIPLMTSATPLQPIQPLGSFAAPPAQTQPLPPPVSANPLVMPDLPPPVNAEPESNFSINKELVKPPEPLPPRPGEAPPPGPVAALPKPAPHQDGPYALISVWNYLGIFLLMLIPVVNLILLIVWACGGCRKVNKKNFARAGLLMILICLLVTALFTFVFGGLITAALQQYGVDLRQVQQVLNLYGSGDWQLPNVDDWDFFLPDGEENLPDQGADAPIAPEDWSTQSISDLQALIAGGAVSAEALAALQQLFLLDEDVLRANGATDGDLLWFQAIKDRDRAALLSLGASEAEIDEVFQLLDGEVPPDNHGEAPPAGTEDQPSGETPEEQTVPEGGDNLVEIFE